MAISKELFLAILSMDSYNRGYAAGISGLGGEGSKIGIATVKKDSEQLLDDSSAIQAGFYAVSYEISSSDNLPELSNETVISFRGTDDPLGSDSGNDLWNGWWVGAGFTDWPWGGGSQATFAKEFYEAVSGLSLYDVQGDKPILTGHSLGAGLAGFVSLASGSDAVVFDHMPFTTAALSTIAEEAEERAAHLGLLIDHDEESNDELNLLNMNPINFEQIQGFYLDNEINAGLRDGSIAFQIGGLLSTWLYPILGPIPAILGTYIGASQIAGELKINNTELKTYSGVDGYYDFGRINLHSMHYLIQIQFATEFGFLGWQSLGEEFFRAYFNGDVADAAGADDIAGENSPTGTMGNALAYSAIDEGTLIFGNTGIHERSQKCA